MTPIMVRSCPVEICDFSLRSRSRSIMWSTSLSEASGFNTMIIIPSLVLTFPYTKNFLEGLQEGSIFVGLTDSDTNHGAFDMPHDNPFAQQGVEHRSSIPFHVNIEKIRLTRDRSQSKLTKRLSYLLHPGFVDRPALGHMLIIPQCSQCGLLGKTVGIDGRPNSIQEVDDLRGTD